MDISLPDAESTVEFGRQLGRALNEQYAEGGEQVHIILFYGDLGSGKTTFTRGFIEALPGGENAEVSSPSFTLCNSYPTTPSVIHCDLYRSEGALPDEVDEALDTESGLVLVEWAERAPHLAEMATITISLAIPPGGVGRTLAMTRR